MPPADSTDEPALGHIALDDQTTDEMLCPLAVAADQATRFRRGAYVRIDDRAQDLQFLGRTVRGPVYLAADANTRDGSSSAGPYEVGGTVELLGLLTEGTHVRPGDTRPSPGSTVTVLPNDQLRRLLDIDGDIQLGRLSGHEDIAVCTASESKDFLPRNVGIFGTVGSGKSNTAQVLIEEAAAAGWAVVVVDVEGEYVRMDQPSSDARLGRLLREGYGIDPAGITDFQVYVPTSGRSAAESAVPFKIPISALDPEVLADVLELSAEERRVFNSVTERAIRQFVPPPGSPSTSHRPYTLQQLVDGLMEGGSAVSGHATIRMLPYASEADVTAAGTLRAKLLYLGRTGMLDWNDTASVPDLPVEDLLVGGRLSVLDVAETTDRSRNLAIAYVLQGLFDLVLATPRGEPMPSGQPRPPLLVVLEEVHTFVARAAAERMRAVLDNLQTISRRGRKRWMALALVSQQPNHVPDEIFELTNTRFIHQLKSLANLDPVKETTGSVDESLWETVPALAPGRALLTGSAFSRPLFVDIRPARSQRLLAG